MYSINDTYKVADVAESLQPKIPTFYTLSSLDIAIMIAVEAHAGQVDKQGAPYILHVLRVGARGITREEQICGILHDLMEDVPTYDIRKIITIFGPEIYEALLCLTHNKDESYNDYIDRCITNPISRNVKRHDLLDNQSRLEGLPKGDQVRLLKKYQYALAQLGKYE